MTLSTKFPDRNLIILPDFIFSFLRGLELVQIQKTLKEEFGGGTKEFTVREVSSFVSLASLLPFYYLLLSLVTLFFPSYISHIGYCACTDKPKIGEMISTNTG